MGHMINHTKVASGILVAVFLMNKSMMLRTNEKIGRRNEPIWNPLVTLWSFGDVIGNGFWMKCPGIQKLNLVVCCIEAKLKMRLLLPSNPMRSLVS